MFIRDIQKYLNRKINEINGRYNDSILFYRNKKEYMYFKFYKIIFIKSNVLCMLMESFGIGLFCIKIYKLIEKNF